jgi:hypothetical protein
MVHRRVIDGDEVIFGVHGALWGNAMTWWDHDTGSVWSQPLGEAIAGPRKGKTVELMTSEFTTWGAWRSEHPDSLALDVDAGPSSFDLDDFLIVIDFGSEARAYPIPDLRSVGVVNDVVAGVEVAVVSDPAEPNRWKVFSRRIGDDIVELSVDRGVLRDATTGSTFDIVRGFGLSGPLEDQVLDQLPALTSFPGDYPTFWPDGTVWSPPS